MISKGVSIQVSNQISKYIPKKVYNGITLSKERIKS